MFGLGRKKAPYECAKMTDITDSYFFHPINRVPSQQSINLDNMRTALLEEKSDTADTEMTDFSQESIAVQPPPAMQSNWSEAALPEALAQAIDDPLQECQIKSQVVFQELPPSVPN